MAPWSKCCVVVVLFFTSGLLCVHAQDAAESVQAGVTNVTVNASSPSATVQAQVKVQEDTAIGSMPSAFTHSMANRAASINAFRPAASAQADASMKNAFRSATSRSGPASQSKQFSIFNPVNTGFNNPSSQGAFGSASPQSRPALSFRSRPIMQKGSHERSGEQAAELQENLSVRSLAEKYYDSYAGPVVAAGEFPDSTRQKIWPSPRFESNEGLFSFQPAVSGLQPEFAQAVEPHYYYSGSTSRITGITASAGNKTRLGQNELNRVPTGLAPVLTPDQTLASPLQNWPSTTPSTSIGLTDPLASDPQQ